MVSIAACWTGVPGLDRGKRGLERGTHYPLESPILAFRVILRPQQPEGTFSETCTALVLSDRYRNIGYSLGAAYPPLVLPSQQ